MADMDTYDADQRAYEDDRDYPPRDRSRSPIADRGDRDSDARIRDEPMNGRGDRDGPSHDKSGNNGDDATNPGSNLFVTGIHPRLTEDEVLRLFEKYGTVEKCNIMRDPHTRESRGFGFVKMVTAEEADSAKEALQGQDYEGRTLSIEKARRARPRTPTPGKYFGPPKREDDRPPRAGGYRDRYDDRGYGRRDDHRRGGGSGGGYRDRGERGGDYRGYGGRYNDYGPRIDRYASREDRGYGSERRSHYGSYDRSSRGPGESSGNYSESAPRDVPPPRNYSDDRRRYD